MDLFSQDKSIIIDDFIDDGKQLWNVPGMSVVIVKDDSTWFKKAYGNKNYFVESNVDTKTIFSMASTTKAFIAMALGILVDRDSIRWNDKVLSHMSRELFPCRYWISNFPLFSYKRLRIRKN